MSYEDGIIWRTHLDLYLNKAEPLAITKITPLRVNVEEYSGKARYPDGTVENIGVLKVLSLDRQELSKSGRVVRGRIMYSLHDPDDEAATDTDVSEDAR